jgi:hypothetical protein
MATSQSNSASEVQLQDGEAITPTGEVVTMGTEAEDRELTNLARKLIVLAKAKQKVKRELIVKNKENRTENQSGFQSG